MASHAWVFLSLIILLFCSSTTDLEGPDRFQHSWNGCWGCPWCPPVVLLTPRKQEQENPSKISNSLSSIPLSLLCPSVCLPFMQQQ